MWAGESCRGLLHMGGSVMRFLNRWLEEKNVIPQQKSFARSDLENWFRSHILVSLFLDVHSCRCV